jgi:hypothetical protein
MVRHEAVEAGLDLVDVCAVAKHQIHRPIHTFGGNRLLVEVVVPERVVADRDRPQVLRRRALSCHSRDDDPSDRK